MDRLEETQEDLEGEDKKMELLEVPEAEEVVVEVPEEQMVLNVVVMEEMPQDKLEAVAKQVSKSMALERFTADSGA